MDTSEIYIKMCERAREIQDVSLSFGDYYWFNKDWHIFLEGAYAISPEHFVWLPRQDQLQEILFTHKEHLFPQCVLLREFIREGELYILHFLKSMEQLWLAFVMYKKFNKIWNGEDWVKEIE